MVKINKSEVIPKPRYPTRSGVLKSSLNVKVERGPGRLPQHAWQKEAEKKLADAKKLKRERNKKLIELTELDHYRRNNQQRNTLTKQEKSMILWKQNL